jgi:hypothetical protein
MSTISPTNGPQNINSAKKLDQLQAGMTKGKSKQFRYQDITYSICMNKPRGLFRKPTFTINRLNADGSTVEKITAETFNKNKFFKAIEKDVLEKQFDSGWEEIKEFKAGLKSKFGKLNLENNENIQNFKKEMQNAAKNSTQSPELRETIQSYLNKINNLELKSDIPMEDKLPILKELCARCNDDKLSEDVRNEAKEVLFNFREKIKNAANDSTQSPELKETIQLCLNNINELELKFAIHTEEKLAILKELCERCNNDKLSEDVRNGAKEVLLGYGGQLARDFLLAFLKGNKISKKLNNILDTLSDKNLKFPGDLQKLKQKILNYNLNNDDDKKKAANLLLKHNEFKRKKGKPFLQRKDVKLLKSIADPQSNSPSVKNKKKSATQKTHQSKNEKKTKEDLEFPKNT